jgi:hypothetical protein
VGIRPVSNVPEVILLAPKSGIRPVSNVPEVILLAAKPGIRPVSNDPEVILLAAKLGMSLAVKLSLSELIVPLVKLDAFKDESFEPSASIAPALKSPFVSLTTIFEAVFDEVAVIVAEFARLRDALIPAAVFFRMTSSTEE